MFMKSVVCLPIKCLIYVYSCLQMKGGVLVIIITVLMVVVSVSDSVSDSN